jgi:hypothetical protein
MSDLTTAFDALSAKQAPQTALWGYYDGEQPLAYSSQRLCNIFQDLDAHFSENWSAVVVDSLKDRINLTGFRNEAQQTALDTLWDGSELNLGSDDVHEAALVVGESYLIIWPDENGVPQAHCNDPRLCHVQYSAENPRVAAWAAKRWVDEAGKLRMTLYYPDRLEYYISTNKAQDVSLATGLQPMSTPDAPNPYQQIPVFHFRPQRRIVKGELNSVVPLQDSVNKLFSDMMVASEFAALPQRYIIATMPDDQPNLQNRAWEIWQISGGGDGKTQVGQFPAAELSNFLAAIDHAISVIGTITRTPRHYFLNSGTGRDLSGEALIAMEGPLNKKAQDRIDAFTPTWQQAMAFALKVLGITVVPSDITPLFDKPETIQPRTAADITNIRVATGVPLRSALRWEGIEQPEIDDVLKEQKEEQAATGVPAPVLDLRDVAIKPVAPAVPPTG